MSAEYLFGAQVAMSLGSALFGAQGDTKDYNRRINAINAEADAINNSTIFRYQMSQLQQQQSQDRSVIEVGDRLKALREATGTAGAAAATAGVDGPSVDALMTAFDVSTGNDVSNIMLQRNNEIAQSRAEMKGTEMDARNRLVSLQNQIPEDPSTKIMSRFLNSAFQIGGAFLQNTTADKSAFLGRRFG